jgi:hypothetical protein
VDDVVIKTRSHDEFIPDLEETFNSLRKFLWKLNPTKCVFDVPQGKLLGFIISHRGIEGNSEKITTITAVDAPRTVKDVQKLTNCMAALNRFISRLEQRGLPFFKLIKCHDKFQWTEEVKQELQDLKHHLQSPPILTAPNQVRTCYSTSPRLLTSSARQSWWSAKKKAMLSVCSSQSTSSAKSFMNPRFITQQFRNYSMVYSSLPESFAIISTHTTSRWSLISHWRISSTIRMPLGASPSGQWNWGLLPSISSPGRQSSCRH